MGIKLQQKSCASAIESYAAPMCYELAGKTLNIKMDGGETVTLTFAASTACGAGYDCAKIDKQVYYTGSETAQVRTAYVLDMDKCLATRIVTDKSGKSAIAFGSFGDAGTLHAITNELDGNVVNWTLDNRVGIDAFKVTFGKETTIDNALIKAVADSSTVKITDSVYLHTATVSAAGETYGACLVANYRNVTCVGGVFGAKSELFGGYGRIVTEQVSGRSEERRVGKECRSRWSPYH